MPTKSVRDMTVREQKRYSLSGRMFRLILLLAIAIGLAGLFFSFYLYNDSICKEYMKESWQISVMSAYVINEHDAEGMKDAVLSIYEEQYPSDDMRGDEDYLSAFDSLKDEQYYELQSILRQLETRFKVYCIYYAVIDKDLGRLIYICDSDLHESTAREPGYFDLSPNDDEYDTYLNGAEITGLDKVFGREYSIPAFISKDEEYGYMCTAATIISQDEHYAAVALVDLSMDDVLGELSLFMWQFVLLLFVATIVIASLITMRMNHTVIKPINQLAGAANKYSKDKYNKQFGIDHFENLEIHTGDEIENLSLTMKDMEADIREYISNLTKVTADKQRITTELDVAREIQAGMIPHVFPPFPGRPEFSLYAMMDPAKEIGGDFYDYFLIDHDHLAFMIADVTGKGVPAALFMMSAKTILATTTLGEGKSPGKILSLVNQKICENNPADMFVTAWLGILETNTGKVICANAGHEIPVVRRAGGSFEQFNASHGTVIGCFQDAEYPEYEIQLHPGDVIFQYTDGATDAVNNNDEFFGSERLMKALNAKNDNVPQEIINDVKNSLLDFADGASQFDDLTMICLQYLGSQSMKAIYLQEEVEFTAELKNWEKIANLIEKTLGNMDCRLKDCQSILIAAEEIFTNICKFAYPDLAEGEKGTVSVRISVYQAPAMVHVTFTDSGVPFDPLQKEDPDVTLPAEDRIIGGLGIYLVKKLMDDVFYRYNDKKNILTLEKRI